MPFGLLPQGFMALPRAVHAVHVVVSDGFEALDELGLVLDELLGDVVGFSCVAVVTEKLDFGHVVLT